MILADTSIWIGHFRSAHAELVAALGRGDVACHPFVVGELALGHLTRRTRVLELLRELPQAPVLDHDDVLTFVELHRLAGTGLGWIDAHLAASAMARGLRLWTHDRNLSRVALRVGIA